ncbi:helix-turn-helix domain-containing protein [Corynebacterium lizhenjunii]|uniref:Helix-turn-helix domain-containing protein n=1 Tax=Corynebacterium lizhenjunii TaxID=2709394 RepID=A0A7T0KEB1_9CORY|nr:helix-turn-helix domain-containing protein [Corynebacterium lizhenjunii]QPK79221.1 helix-turn-helix domain-containing protein [Corynebacterium lizhenjunii]
MDQQLTTHAIPAAGVKRMHNQREPMLMWVYTGLAKVEILGEKYLLRAGHAVWIPAGVEYGISTRPGTVAFPIFPAARDMGVRISRPHRVRVGREWGPWLVYQFARSIGYLQGTAPGLAALAPQVAADGAPGCAVALPPQPFADAALDTAMRILQDPGSPATVEQLASAASVSTRTLQKQFVAQTGMSIVQWRRQVRVALAAGLIAAGQHIGWAARQVGFETTAGLTRAFHSHVGMSPREFAQLKPPVPELADAPLTSPPPVPASQTWERVNDFHVLVWVYRGAARVVIGRQTYELIQGDVAWLPAGESNVVHVEQGAIVLPLGSREAKLPTVVPGVLVQSFADIEENYLLHTVVANYSHLRPDGHDPHAIVYLFARRAQEAARCGDGVGQGAVTAAVVEVLHRVRATPEDRRTLAQWATELGVSTLDLSQGVHAAVGMPFKQWRSQLRMTVARSLLEQGKSVEHIARRLGYAHPSSFCKVFSDNHRMSPREYQRSGWQCTQEALIVP